MRDDRGPGLHTVSTAFQQSTQNRKGGRWPRGPSSPTAPLELVLGADRLSVLEFAERDATGSALRHDTISMVGLARRQAPWLSDGRKHPIARSFHAVRQASFPFPPRPPHDTHVAPTPRTIIAIAQATFHSSKLPPNPNPAAFMSPRLRNSARAAAQPPRGALPALTRSSSSSALSLAHALACLICSGLLTAGRLRAVAILRWISSGMATKGRGVQLNQRPIIAWSCGG